MKVKSIYIKYLGLATVIILSGFYNVSAQANFKITDLKKEYQIREAIASPALKARLEIQRKFLADHHYTYHLANTSVSEMRIEHITGAKQLSNSAAKQLQLQMKYKVISPDALALLNKVKSRPKSTQKYYDARNDKYIADIRYQPCGDCWAYAAIGALEASYMLLNSISDSHTVNYSERQVLGCSGAGGTNGGFTNAAFDWMKTNKIRIADDQYIQDITVPHIFNSDTLPFEEVNCILWAAPTATLQLLDWAIVSKSGDINTIATADEIKSAICKYGSATAYFYADDLFQHFAGHGVFDEPEENYKNKGTNHAVLLIGWDDDNQAWLMRNSWGTNWGDGGYAWVKYNCASIGTGAMWAVATKINATVFPPITIQPSVQLTGEYISGTFFNPGSVLKSPNGKYELRCDAEGLWLRAISGTNQWSQKRPTPELYRNITQCVIIANILHMYDKDANDYTPFGKDCKVYKIILEDNGHLYTVDKNNAVTWRNWQPPRIRTKH